MLNIALILLVSAEFCFYLLIAQTGIVEYFNSDLSIISFLPLGAFFGTVGSLFINFKYKFQILILIQISLTLFYPNLTPLMLFIIGMSLGAISVMIIELLKSSSNDELMLALIISYGVGTILFNSDLEGRWIIGYILSIIVFISSIFVTFKSHLLDKTEFKDILNDNHLSHSIFIMFLWVFLDSTLFESLSRNIDISIWRDGYSMEIILFHTIGVISAIKLDLNSQKEQMIIFISFLFSIIFYLIGEPLLLSIIYPFVISFYNVIILKTLIKEFSFVRLSFIMLAIGWGASGVGLFFALNHWVSYILILVITILIYNLKDKIKLRREYGII